MGEGLNMSSGSKRYLLSLKLQSLKRDSFPSAEALFLFCDASRRLAPARAVAVDCGMQTRSLCLCEAGVSRSERYRVPEAKDGR